MEDIYYSCMQETISLGEKNQADGAEIIKEREQKAEANRERNAREGVMPLIKTLSQALQMDKERFKVPKSVQQAIPHPANLAGWNFSTGNEILKNISFYRYQLLYCE